MSASETVSDPELQEVAWDLSDLLNGASGGDPQAGVDALLADAQTRADAFSDAYAGKLAEIDGQGLVIAMRELAEIEEIAARAGTYAHLAFSTDTQSPANGALLQRVEEKGTAIETKLLFFHLEWAALDDAKAEELLATDGLDFARHHLATARRYRPHLLSEPEERILAEKQLSGRSAWTRLFEEQTAAITVDLPDAGEVPLDAALSNLFHPGPRGAQGRRRARHGGAAARAAHARLCLQHAARGQDGRRPAARLPALAGRAQSEQRGVRRVRAGAHRGRPRPLRGAASLVPPEGAAAGHRQARGLRPHGRRHAGQREDQLAGGQGDRPGRVLHVLRRAGRDHRPVLRQRVDRRPGAAGQARRRVLLLRRAFAAPVRALELHAPAPGRADARARARAWRARGAGRVARRLPYGDAA